MLCVGLGAIADDLATELLVRILRSQSIDARHLSLHDLGAATIPRVVAQDAGIVYIVSAFPGQHRDRAAAVAGEIRHRFPHAQIVAVFLPGLSAEPSSPDMAMSCVNGITRSFAETLRLCVGNGAGSERSNAHSPGEKSQQTRAQTQSISSQDVARSQAKRAGS